MTTISINKNFGFEALGGILTPSAYVRSWNRSLAQLYITRSASISSNVNTALDFLLSEDVNVEDNGGLKEFLTSCYGIVPYLYEIPEKISQCFGRSSLQLGIFSDPDSGDEQSELYLEVETHLSPEEANARLSKINREWVLASNNQDLTFLNITLKFI